MPNYLHRGKPGDAFCVTCSELIDRNRSYNRCLPPGKVISSLAHLPAMEQVLLFLSLHLFIRSFIHSSKSFIPSFTSSLTRSSIHSFAHSSAHPFMRSFIRSSFSPFIHPFIHSLILIKYDTSIASPTEYNRQQKLSSEILFP